VLLKKRKEISGYNSYAFHKQLGGEVLRSYLAVTIRFLPWAKNHFFDNLISIIPLRSCSCTKNTPSDSITEKAYNGRYNFLETFCCPLHEMKWVGINKIKGISY